MTKTKTDLRDEYRGLVDEGLEQDTLDKEAHEERKDQARKESSARKALFWTVLLITTGINVTLYLAPELLRSSSQGGKNVTSRKAVEQKIETFEKTVIARESEGKALPESATRLLTTLPEQVNNPKKDQNRVVDGIEDTIRKDFSSAGLSPEEIDRLITYPNDSSLVIAQPKK